MVIDCDTCLMRDVSCGDCVINVLLSSPPVAMDAAAGRDGRPAQTDIDPVEYAAIGSLADFGLVPPLRLVPKRPA